MPPDSESEILSALSDPSKCNAELVRRLDSMLHPHGHTTAKPATKVQRTTPKTEENTARRRMLAMRAANTASQTLGVVAQSSWKALDSKPTASSMNGVLSIFSSFRMAITVLRVLIPGTIDVEKVASCFVGKLIAVQLYEHALELLEEITISIGQLCHGPRDRLPKKSALPKVAKPPSLATCLHLVQCSLPAPTDPVLLGLIATTLGQALTAVAARVARPPTNETMVEAFASSVEGSGGLLSWHPFLPKEHADTLMARAHRALASTFFSPDISPALLLRIRTWALRFLLRKSTLDSDSFWIQATNYMASHGKSVTQSEDVINSVSAIVTYFDNIVAAARERDDATIFMSGPSFVKFCELALVFVQRGGNMFSLNRIVQFINTAGPTVDKQISSSSDLNAVKAHATFSQGVTILEQSLENGAGRPYVISAIGLPDTNDAESDVLHTVTRCTEAVSACLAIFSSANVNPSSIHNLERLRRACGRVLEDAKAGDELTNAVKLALVTIVNMIENSRLKQTGLPAKMMSDLTLCAVDSLCTLAKVELNPADTTTYIASYSYLERAVTLVDLHLPPSSQSNAKTDALVALAKVIRSVSGAFWKHAVVLYQAGKYAPAIRFLVQACELGAKAYDMVWSARLDDKDASLEPKDAMWTTLKTHLSKRWELLGECHSKIGDRRLAHDAFLQSLKTQDFESLCHSAACSSPDQIISEVAHRRIASLVERITYIAVSNLFLQGDASLRQILCASQVEPAVIGLLLEWQAAYLEENLWKVEVRSAVAHFLRDALDVYGMTFPIRRARVLLRQLELAHRIDDLSVPIADIGREIHALLSQPRSMGNDVGLADLQPQYQAATHMWLVFHAHRRSENNSHSTVILQHATLASKILRGVFPAAPVSLAKSPKRSPKLTTTKASTMTLRNSPRKKATTARPDPVTPKKPRKMVIQTPLKLTCRTTSPKSPPSKPNGLVCDSRLVTTIQMLAQLMGLLGHVFLKIQFLNILQRMTERSFGPSADDFVRACVDAAIEYVRLGKNQRALTIFVHTLTAVTDATASTVSEEVRVTLLLHYSETLALTGNTEKSFNLYEEARRLTQRLEFQQSRSTAARIRARVLMLERSALASHVFSVLQIAQDDPHAAFSTLRQSLRLWNRAFDSLSRLSPKTAPESSNPFDMSSLAEALPTSVNQPSQKDIPFRKRAYHRNTTTDGLQWRIAQGLLNSLFALGRAYFLQGSVRGSEYFVEQARDLAGSLNAPAMLGRALAKQGELRLHQSKLEEAATSLLEAANFLRPHPGIDAADVNRLRAHHSQLVHQHGEAQDLYLETISMLSEMEKMLATIDSGTHVPRKSLTQSPGRSIHHDVLMPGLVARVLKQQLWLQRNEPRAKTKILLDQLIALPPSSETKAEELAILAKLALHDAHVQFRADLFLSSLAESTIAVPMGVSSHDVSLSPSAKQMLETLSTAAKMFWSTLDFISNRGQASYVREATVSLALIQSFQASLGKVCNNGARVAAGLLDASAAITLRRELVDAIEQKFPEPAADDLVWPTTSGRSPSPIRGFQPPQSMGVGKESEHQTIDLQGYWQSVRDRYYSAYDLDQSISESQVDLLPPNWTVVSVNITDDKSTMFFSRQRPNREPLIFCVPLERHGRKEEDEDEQFTYHDAMDQLNVILQQSEQSAKSARDVPSENRDAKAAWWAERVSLDKRMQELLDNIEFCWLGAFKTILSEPVKIPPDILNGLRTRFDKVFKRNLASDKKRTSRMKLDDTLVECFALLSPKCRDEELEDLIYFVLDLYQFHGIHVALSEVDMDQVAVELRTALEEHASKSRGRIVPEEDAHLFLVLDKNVQGIPWESIPILRGRSVSRIPSLSFLLDRIEFAKLQREAAEQPIGPDFPLDRAPVNPRNTYYVLNPSGDLTKSEARFGSWVKEMEAPAVGWQGIVGRVPSEQELLDAFTRKDLVIYVGHGGAEQYVRSHKIRHLPRCAATMLWGCSSGLMRDMGDFDRAGTPYNYMLAGCPTLVACLWDVTDNELDKFSRSVFDKLRLDAEHVKAWSLDSIDEGKTSVVTAVCQSRDVCKLKYLTGAAPVVYGIPFYL